MSLEQLAVKRFFSSGYFAVAGASSDPAKFGVRHRLPSLLSGSVSPSAFFCLS
jgi:hypothetical protein